jgi:hypothetical protein
MSRVSAQVAAVGDADALAGLYEGLHDPDWRVRQARFNCTRAEQGFPRGLVCSAAPEHTRRKPARPTRLVAALGKSRHPARRTATWHEALT